MYRSFLLFAALLFVSACGSADAPDAVDDAVQSAPQAPSPIGPIEMIATDYAFEAPASVEGGVREVRLVNHGAELHHVQFVRLADGFTPDDLNAAYSAGNYHPDFASDVGGPNLVPPGGSFTATVDLVPGNYVALCVIPDANMVPHAEHGMVTAMEVTEPTEVRPLPEADLVLTMQDYGFALSGPITAGTQTIRLQTAAEQSHEWVVFRLPEGGTADGILQWIEDGQQGPPPFQPVGGIAAMGPGETNQITLDFEPGTYAFICFIPDATDGAPHFVHGMVQEYVVS